MRGYAYDRRDVTGRGLANAYAQTLGTIFSSGGEKPYEVEIFVAEVGDTVEDDQIYRLTYDGQVADEYGFAVMGGNTEVVTGHLRENYRRGPVLGEVLQLAVARSGRATPRSRVTRPRTSRSRCSTAPGPSSASSSGSPPSTSRAAGRAGAAEAGRHAAGESTNPSNT